MGDFEIKAEISLFGEGVAHFIGYFPETPRQLLKSFGSYHFCTNPECVEKPKHHSAVIPKNEPLVTLIQPSLRRLETDNALSSSQTLKLLTQVEQLLRTNIKPRRCGSDCTGGVWIFYDSQNKPLAVFKPCEEEAGLKSGEPARRGICPGEGALHEFAVNYLSHSESGAPITALVSISHSIFGEKPTVGTLQEYIPHTCSSWDMGSSLFATEDVHSIGLLDLRFLNTDRHGGNILVTNSKTLVPIDHTYCLPETLDETWFEWLQWKQSRKPFSAATKQRLLDLPVEQDMIFLKSCGFSSRIIFNFALANMIIKEGVRRDFTLFDLGKICSRIIIDSPAPIEEIYTKAASACVLNFDCLFDFLASLTEFVSEYFDAHPSLTECAQ
jgi:hypothetical protein